MPCKTKQKRKKKQKIPLRSSKRAQISLSALILGPLIIITILTLAAIYVLMPDPTDFIIGLGWIDEALVAIGGTILSAGILWKVVLKQ